MSTQKTAVKLTIIGVCRIFLKKFLFICVRCSVGNLSGNVSLRILLNTLITVISENIMEGRTLKKTFCETYIRSFQDT